MSKTPVDNPHVEVEIKPQLKLRGSAAKEEDPKPFHQLYKWQIKSTRSTKQTVSLEYLKGRRELPQRKRTSSDSCGHWKQERTGVGPVGLESGLPPQPVQRSAQCWEGI